MNRVLVPVCLLVCGCQPTLVMFTGDSNTSGWIGCEYPKQWQARQDPGRWASVNEAIFGSAAVGWLHDGTMLTKLDANHPDRVVIALGTNDLAGHRSVGVVVSDLWTLYQQVVTYTLPSGHHPVAYIATVPPVYAPPEPGTPAAEDVSALRLQATSLNALIRLRFPKDRVLDFDSWMPHEWTAGIMYKPTDGVHLGCQGHAARANVVGKAL